MKQRLARLLSSCHFYALITILIWASANVMTRAYTGYYYAPYLCAIRFLFAALTMLVIVAVKRIRPPLGRDLLWTALAGLSGLGLYTIAVTYGMQTINASTCSLIVATAPVLTALFARLLLSEKLSSLGWVAIAVEFSGIAVLTFTNGAVSISAGMLWAFVSALSMCVYNLMQRRLTQKYSALCLTAYGIFATALVQAPLLPAAIRSLETIPPAAVAAVAYLGICSSALGYLFWAKAISLARSTSEVTNWMFLNPLLTALLGFVTIFETPDTATLLGGAIILVGLLIFRAANAKKPVDDPAETAEA